MRTKFSRILTLMLAFMVQMSFAQQKTVSGTVTDDMGLPLPGVNIVVKGTTSGTQSDFDGNYSISVAVGQALVFSYVGFQTVERAVTPTTTTLNLSMSMDAASLDEVVVTGYSNRNRSVLASAVSTINATEIEQMVPTTTVDNMLQGRASGVQVTAANGKPGQNAFVRIRGQSSLTAGAMEPLYIVDGSPVREQDLNILSGNDIESISILKDAATTAQYGSRGAAGVVIITTKSGNRNREATVRVNSRIGFTEKIKDNFDMMNASQKLDYERELAELGVGAANNLPGNTATPEERAFLLENALDWQDVMLRKGAIQSNSFSVSGGAEKFDYFFSAGHERDEGVLRDVFGFERINTRLNVNFDAKEWLNLTTSIAYSRTLSDDARDRNNAQNPFRAAYDINPYETIYLLDEDGNPQLDEFGNPLWNWTTAVLNPVEYLQTNQENITRNNLIGSIGGTVKFSDRWSYRFLSSFAKLNEYRFTYGHPGNRLNQLIGDPEFPGFRSDRYRERFDMTLSNFINYDLATGSHSLNISGLYEFNYNEYNQAFISSSGYSSPDVFTVSNAGRIDDAFTNKDKITLLSYGAFLNYDYKQRYIFSSSARFDGSSNFGENNRWGFFYSLAAAWNIAKEDFFDVREVNDLKLRVSYGTIGNRNIGTERQRRYPHLGTVATVSGYPGGTATRLDNVSNPDLKWESTEMTDIAIEFSLFNHRLRGVAGYYIKKTDDLLFRVPMPYETGSYVVNSNIGSIENKGVEIELAGDIIRKPDFRWTVGGNITFYDHKILSLPEGEPGENNDIEPVMAFNIVWSEGQMINQHYLLQYAGVDPETGNPLYYNRDRTITGTFDEINNLEGDQRAYTGKSTIADFEGGFYTDFNYKGWGLRADFAYKSGNYIYNQVRANVMSDGRRVTANQAVDAFNYWQQPGDTDVLPSPLAPATALGAVSDRWLEKGDYIRLRNVMVSYNFPQSILERTPFSSVRLYAQGQNLLTFTKFYGDPEVGISSGETIDYTQTVAPGETTLYSYPNRKSYTFGIDLSF